MRPEGVRIERASFADAQPIWTDAKVARIHGARVNGLDDGNLGVLVWLVRLVWLAARSFPVFVLVFAITR